MVLCCSHGVLSTDGVCDALTNNIEGRSLDWFEQRYGVLLRVEIGYRRNFQGTDQRRRYIDWQGRIQTNKFNGQDK